MRSIYEEMLQVSRAYMSPINAEGVLQRAIRLASLRAEELNPANIPVVINTMGNALRLFLNETERTQLLTRLQALATHGTALPEARVELQREQDLLECRSVARNICEALGVGPFGLQKLATLASELARNVVKYTPGGHLLFRPEQATRCIVVIAEDRGPGISNLPEILAGKYRSRTGLGQGILGCKRLASRFDIRTGPTGTRIEAEVHFDTAH
ncbi:MAG: ATP-binding protein [Myxococcota bacterium]